MATQYTAGLTTGQVLTAATMNSIGAAWETWTPTVAATAGTITAGSVTRAKYTRIDKLVICDFSYLITTAGTAAGASLTTTLPIPAVTTFAGYYMGSGREYAAVGFSVMGLYVAPLVRIVDYTGAGWIQSGRGASVTFAYEAA